MEPIHFIKVGKLKKEYVARVAELAYDNLEVILTRRVESEHDKEHPELIPLKHLFGDCISAPDEVHRNKRDSDVVVFYKLIEEGKYKGRYVRLTLLLNINQPKGYKHSIISYRLANIEEVKRGSNRSHLIWFRRELS